MTWRLTDDNSPRTLAEIEACRAYQRNADTYTTVAVCKCGAESRGGRCCLACCNALERELKETNDDAGTV